MFLDLKMFHVQCVRCTKNISYLLHIELKYNMKCYYDELKPDTVMQNSFSLLAETHSFVKSSRKALCVTIMILY